MKKRENKRENKRCFTLGMRHGIPIGLGYFAVAFTLGITAKNIGLSPLQATLMSFLMHASAGEFAAFQVIAAGAPYMEMAVTTFVINLRYLLMSSALSQKLSEKTWFPHRLFMSHYLTDEIFGLASTVDGKLNPFYLYGMACTAAPGWELGTFLGATVGSILPNNVSSALNIALYGMFLAIVIPPTKKPAIAILVVLSMLLSALLTATERWTGLSSGVRILLLTVLIAGVAAFVRPIEEGSEDGK